MNRNADKPQRQMHTAITYISRPAAETSTLDVMEIWGRAYEENENRKITGALYFGGDIFLQVIEGEEKAVEGLFDKIKIDRRHLDVTLLAINDVATSMFHDTPMKLIDGSQSKMLRERFDYETLVAEGPAGAGRAAFSLRRI